MTAGAPIAFSAILLGPVVLTAQIRITPPEGGSTYRQSYGDPEAVELFHIAYNGETYQKRNVRTRGMLDALPLSPYFVLSEGGAQLLVIPVPELASGGGLQSLLGRRVEVTGVVRVLPEHQAVLRCGLESKCNDPELPELPNARIEWPHVSITIFSVGDIDPGSSARPGTLLAELVEAPAAHAGKKVRVVGRFRGYNLFADLPAASQHGPSDWVLQDADGAHAVWVTGMPPRGRGFDLDPARKSDRVWWLEVEGRPEVQDGIVYVRASKVRLTTDPAKKREER